MILAAPATCQKRKGFECPESPIFGPVDVSVQASSAIDVGLGLGARVVGGSPYRTHSPCKPYVPACQVA